MLSQATATRINAFVSNIYWGAINFVYRQLDRKTVQVNFKEGLKLQILRVWFYCKQLLVACFNWSLLSY